MTDYEDEIIRKYREVKDGIKVTVEGFRNGTAEKLSIEVPSERGHFRLPDPPPLEGQKMQWHREKLSGSLYLLWGISQDGQFTEVFLCRNGCSKKIPIAYKDLNYPQFLKLKRKLKQLDQDARENLYKNV